MTTEKPNLRAAEAVMAEALHAIRPQIVNGARVTAKQVVGYLRAKGWTLAATEPVPTWTCDWQPDDLNPGPDCPYCAGQMCARFDGLGGCHHDQRERHGYPATEPVPTAAHYWIGDRGVATGGNVTEPVHGAETCANCGSARFPRHRADGRLECSTCGHDYERRATEPVPEREGLRAAVMDALELGGAESLLRRVGAVLAREAGDDGLAYQAPGRIAALWVRDHAKASAAEALATPPTEPGAGLDDTGGNAMAVAELRSIREAMHEATGAMAATLPVVLAVRAWRDTPRHGNATERARLGQRLEQAILDAMDGLDEYAEQHPLATPASEEAGNG